MLARFAYEFAEPGSIIQYAYEGRCPLALDTNVMVVMNGMCS